MWGAVEFATGRGNEGMGKSKHFGCTMNSESPVFGICFWCQSDSSDVPRSLVGYKSTSLYAGIVTTNYGNLHFTGYFGKTLHMVKIDILISNESLKYHLFVTFTCIFFNTSIKKLQIFFIWMVYKHDTSLVLIYSNGMDIAHCVYGNYVHCTFS